MGCEFTLLGGNSLHNWNGIARILLWWQNRAFSSYSDGKMILKDIQLGQAYLVSGRDELILHSGFKTTIVQLGPFLDPPTLKVQYFFWCNLQWKQKVFWKPLGVNFKIGGVNVQFFRFFIYKKHFFRDVLTLHVIFFRKNEHLKW